jgi:integral membrane sensor domain MASE1
MLTGAVLGALVMLLVFVILFLIGQNAAYRGQVTKLSKEQAAADMQLARLAATVQRCETQPIQFNITEEQLTFLANKLSARCQMIMDSANEAALKKLS